MADEILQEAQFILDVGYEMRLEQENSPGEFLADGKLNRTHLHEWMDFSKAPHQCGIDAAHHLAGRINSKNAEFHCTAVAGGVPSGRHALAQIGICSRRSRIKPIDFVNSPLHFQRSDGNTGVGTLPRDDQRSPRTV